MKHEINAFIFLCLLIASVMDANSGDDEKYEEAKSLLDECELFNSPHEKWKAQKCYKEVLTICEEICPSDDCSIRITNLQVKAQVGIDSIESSIGPSPGTNNCSCQLDENYIPISAKYNNSILKNKGDIISWNDRGAFFADRCCFDEALKSFEEAIRINPDLATVWYNKGLLLYEKRPQEALECFNRSINIDPAFAEAWFNRCSLLSSFDMDMNSPSGKEAKRSYDEALKLKPELADYIPPVREYRRMA